MNRGAQGGDRDAPGQMAIDLSGVDQLGLFGPRDANLRLQLANSVVSQHELFDARVAGILAKGRPREPRGGVRREGHDTTRLPTLRAMQRRVLDNLPPDAMLKSARFLARHLRAL